MNETSLAQRKRASENQTPGDPASKQILNKTSRKRVLNTNKFTEKRQTFMNNTRTIDINSLTPGIFIVKGKLSYSRLARHVEGDELIEDQRRRHANGLIAIYKPYTTATVYDAQVKYAVTQNMAKFAEEQFFTSINSPDSLCFSAINKGNSRPIVSKSLDGGKHATEIDIGANELAQDTEVLLVVRIFKSKNSANNCMTLDHVIILGEPRFYKYVGEEELKRAGITFISTAKMNSKISKKLRQNSLMPTTSLSSRNRR